MTYVLVQHKIGKWEEFESIFKDDAPRRKRLGSLGGKLFRNIQDPQNLFVTFEWDNVENAKRFAEGLETNEAMEWATSGIWSRVSVVEEVYEVDA
jgi:heme-degrading monooxygenase HmoA